MNNNISNNTNTNADTKINYNYKPTLNVDYWKNFLKRDLKKNEFLLIKQAEGEIYMNKKINDILMNAKTHNLYVPQLTELDGNCIFESLKCLKLIDNVPVFRCGLAYMLLVFKNVPNFLPNQESSLEEIFNVTNNIQNVYCNKTNTIYKYTFTAMCIDLATNHSWTKLNTELIFLGLSVMLNVRINIFHNNGHLTEITTFENDKTTTINLGLIDEIHYIPLAIKPDNLQNIECPKYTDNVKNFHAWARKMCVLNNKTN